MNGKFFIPISVISGKKTSFSFFAGMHSAEISLLSVEKSFYQLDLSFFAKFVWSWS